METEQMSIFDLNSILMAAAGTSALSRGAGNELEPACNAGRMDGGNIFYNASRNFLTRIPEPVYALRVQAPECTTVPVTIE